MRFTELKIMRIGNSLVVRLPEATVDRYRIGASVVMEERRDGILLRSPGARGPELSWKKTAREMAAEARDWSEWDSVVADGLLETRWDGKRSVPVVRRKAKSRLRVRCRNR